MKVCRCSLSPSVARGLAAVYAVLVAAGALPAHADTAERAAPRERAWWAFQQRAYPLGYIPQHAQMRALRQMSEARAANASPTGGAAAAERERWINIGPAPILGVRPLSGRVAAIAVEPRDSFAQPACHAAHGNYPRGRRRQRATSDSSRLCQFSR